MNRITDIVGQLHGLERRTRPSRDEKLLRAAHYRADAETQFRIADHHRRCMEYHKRNARARMQSAREIEKEFEE